MSGSMDLEFFLYSFQLQLTHFLLVKGGITAQTDEQSKAGLKIGWMAMQWTAVYYLHGWAKVCCCHWGSMALKSIFLAVIFPLEAQYRWRLFAGFPTDWTVDSSPFHPKGSQGKFIPPCKTYLASRFWWWNLQQHNLTPPLFLLHFCV